MENVAVTVIGVLLAFLQSVIIMLLSNLRNDMLGLRKRMYSHYHEIECNGSSCDARRTGDVIVPHETA